MAHGHIYKEVVLHRIIYLEGLKPDRSSLAQPCSSFPFPLIGGTCVVQTPELWVWGLQMVAWLGSWIPLPQWQRRVPAPFSQGECGSVRPASPHCRAIPTYCQSLWEAAEGSVTKPSSTSSSHLSTQDLAVDVWPPPKRLGPLAGYQLGHPLCVFVSDLGHANSIGNS